MVSLEKTLQVHPCRVKNLQKKAGQNSKEYQTGNINRNYVTIFLLFF